MAKYISVSNIKNIVNAWNCGIHTPEFALKLLLKELDMETGKNKELKGKKMPDDYSFEVGV